MAALTVPDLPTEVDTLTAALAYAKAGWYVGPVKARTKNPGSVLGKGWHETTSRDPGVIASWFTGTNYGVFLHCGRSGAVVLDVDNPDKLHPAIEQAISQCRPPWQSTRPGSPRRGHYVFRMPTGLELGNGLGRLDTGWGDIRGRHGVIVVAPSVHQEDDGKYCWERTGPVPVLPGYVATQVPPAMVAADAAADQQVAQFLAVHTRNKRPELLDIHVRAFRKKVATGESRHQTMCGHLTGAMKEAAAGLLDARTAAGTLESVFLEEVAKTPTGKQGRSRTGPQARNEFAEMLAWAIAQAENADPEEIVARVAERVPLGDTQNTQEFKAGGSRATHESIDGLEAEGTRCIMSPPSTMSATEKSEHHDENSLSDSQLAETVALRFLRGEFLAWGKVGWHRWTGSRWQKTEPDVARRAVRDALNAIYAEQMTANDKRRDDRIASAGGDRGLIASATSEHAATANRLVELYHFRKIDAVCKLARGFVRCELTDFDRNADILNVGNGILDLTTGQLGPHRPEAMCSKITLVHYRAGATHPDWDKALEALPDDVEDWMQIRFGQAATGYPASDDIVPFLKGSGGNGKSCWVVGVQKALGEYATLVPDKVLLGNSRDHPTEMMTLHGARLAYIEELPEGDFIDAQRLKKVVGTDTMIARYIGEDNIQWQTSHSLMVTTNYDVKVATTDFGTWRRLALVEFPYRFDGSDPDRPKDAGLRFRIRDDPAVHEAVLAWVVAGAVRWYAHDKVMPEAPPRVMSDTEQWRLDANDAVLFLDEVCRPNETHAVVASDLYQMFRKWMIARGRKPPSDQIFWDRAKQHRWFHDGSVTKKQARTKAFTRVHRCDVHLVSNLPEKARVLAGVELTEAGEELSDRIQ